MKFIYLLIYLVNCERNIRNINIPACRNCIHYKPNMYNKFTSDKSTCGNFGYKDIITGEIKYDLAHFCRNTQDKCGKEGNYFIQERNLTIKILKHKIIKNCPFIFKIVLVTICVFSFLLRNLIAHKIKTKLLL